MIIDLELFYQKQPADVPSIGLREIPPGDSKEVTESYRSWNQTDQGYRETAWASDIFDDRQIDKHRTYQFLEKNQFLVRWYEPQSQAILRSRDDMVILFPRRIHGFVLRSRTWGKLLSSRIPMRHELTESFDRSA